MVRVATTCVKIRKNSLEANLKEWLKTVDKAGEVNPDIIVLSETVYERGAGLSGSRPGEAIPGTLTEAMALKAKQHHTYIAFSMYERVECTTVYNTAVLLDKKGQIAGMHRKTRLEKSELRNGVKAGDKYSVIKTDIGTIGLMICMEVLDDKIPKLLKKYGADIILVSSIGNFHTKYANIAGNNKLFLTVAGQDTCKGLPDPSVIIDPCGNVISSVTDASSISCIYNAGDGSVVYADIDL